MQPNALIDPALKTATVSQLRTHIAVTFWGKEYRRYFLDYCLASLMSPGNIPAIRNKKAARLLIATTHDDWQELQSEPLIVAAKELIAVEHVALKVPLEVRYDQKMSVMSLGHKLLTTRMFEARAHGVMVYPDVIFADGAIRRIEQIAMDGYRVVLCIAVRFSNEGLLDELKKMGLIKHGMPINISTRELARVTIRNLHSETIRGEFDATFDDRGVCSFFWVVNPGKDLLFHCANWAPVLLDYSAIHKHDASTFSAWTFDGDYVARNFPNIREIYVVRNTEELFVSGFTSESKVSFRLFRVYPFRFASLRQALKIVRAREYMDALNVLDNVKKEFFRVPIRVQGGAASDAEWCAVERLSIEVADRIINLSFVLLICYLCWSKVRRFISFLLRLRRKIFAIFSGPSGTAGV